MKTIDVWIGEGHWRRQYGAFSTEPAPGSKFKLTIPSICQECGFDIGENILSPGDKHSSTMLISACDHSSTYQGFIDAAVKYYESGCPRLEEIEEVSKEIKCDCGAVITNSTHYRWCSTMESV